MTTDPGANDSVGTRPPDLETRRPDGAHTEEFGYIESLDNGKPLEIAKAADVPLAAELFRYMAGWATKIEGNTIPLSVPYTPGVQNISRTRCASRSES